MSKIKKKFIVITILVVLITLSMTYTQCMATNEKEKSISSMQYEDIYGREYYIKNMYSGQYLDVSGGIAASRY